MCDFVCNMWDVVCNMCDCCLHTCDGQNIVCDVCFLTHIDCDFTVIIYTWVRVNMSRNLSFVTYNAGRACDLE